MERTQIGSDLKIGYGTHEGMSGKHNEDFLGVFAWKVDEDTDFYLGVIADGVGGQTAGEVASRLTVSTIQNYFDQLPQLDDVNRHLEKSILKANEIVYRASQENSEYQGMSTTVAMAAILNSRLYTAYVGDSRLYLMRDGALRQLSVDHTWAQEAIEAGLLTREEARTHPNRNVIRRHLGGGLQVEVDHRLVLDPGATSAEAEANQGAPLQPSDTILICSDGLTDMISDKAVNDSLVANFNDLSVASSELIDKANQAGGRDNITVVLMQMPGKAPAAIAATAPVAAGAAKAAAPSVTPAAGPVVAQPKPAIKKKNPPWLVIGGIIILLLLAAAVIFTLVFSRSSNGGSTPNATDIPAIDEPSSTMPAGAPATAAILATGAAAESEDGSGLLATPELIPTLRSTATPTPVRIVNPTATSTRLIAPTLTTDSGTSSSGSDGGSGSTPKPTSPSSSGTSAPATSIPPTSAPSTAAPPGDTPEPPNPQPPTSEPPPSTSDPGNQPPEPQQTPNS